MALPHYHTCSLMICRKRSYAHVCLQSGVVHVLRVTGGRIKHHKLWRSSNTMTGQDRPLPMIVPGHRPSVLCRDGHDRGASPLRKYCSLFQPSLALACLISLSSICLKRVIERLPPLILLLVSKAGVVTSYTGSLPPHGTVRNLRPE